MKAAAWPVTAVSLDLARCTAEKSTTVNVDRALQRRHALCGVSLYVLTHLILTASTGGKC